VLSQFLQRLRGSAASRAVPLTPAVSIGMAAHGNAATTRLALEALFASAGGDFELILVDDQSPDDTLEVFREARHRHGNCRVFSFTRNLEYCQSVNAFLSHARGEQLLFLSNDILASPAYLRELLAAVAANPVCGILRGCSNFVDGRSAFANVASGSFRSRDEFFDFADGIATRHQDQAPVDERYLVGDAFLATRRLVDRIGTFDTRFVGYYGDADFGLRAQIAGFRVALLRSAFAYHFQDANIAYLPEPQRSEKLRRRHQRVGVAMGKFSQKYGIKLGEASVDDIPWERLANTAFDPALHHVAPMDYSQYVLADD